MDGNYVSYSQLSKFLNCRYAWYLGYQYDGTGLVSKTDSGAASFGKAVHEALAALISYRGECQVGGTPERASAGERERVLEYMRDEMPLEAEVDRAVDTAWAAYNGIDWSKYRVFCDEAGPFVERHVIAPLPGFDGFQGFVDAVLQDKDTGALWIVDHKTRKRFYSSRDLESDLQLPIYIYLLSAAGYPVSGTAVHEIRADLVDKFDVDPDTGALSRRPRVRSTTMPTRFTRQYRSPKQVEGVWNNVVLPATYEMLRLHGSLHNPYIDPGGLSGNMNLTPRSLSANICSRCDFRELCFEDLRGGDTDFLLEELYEPKAS